MVDTNTELSSLDRMVIATFDVYFPIASISKDALAIFLNKPYFYWSLLDLGFNAYAKPFLFEVGHACDLAKKTFSRETTFRIEVGVDIFGKVDATQRAFVLGFHNHYPLKATPDEYKWVFVEHAKQAWEWVGTWVNIMAQIQDDARLRVRTDPRFRAIEQEVSPQVTEVPLPPPLIGRGVGIECPQDSTIAIPGVEDDILWMKEEFSDANLTLLNSEGLVGESLHEEFDKAGVTDARILDFLVMNPLQTPSSFHGKTIVFRTVFRDNKDKLYVRTLSFPGSQFPEVGVLYLDKVWTGGIYYFSYNP